MTQTTHEGAAADGAARAANDARDNPALSWAARLGYACYGLVYLLIGWLAAQLALGHHDGSPTRNGALHQLARQPYGRVLLWVTVVGFAALVVWQLCKAVVKFRDREGAKRWIGVAGSAFKLVVFATLALSAAKIAIGARSGGSSGSSQDMTARVLAWPAGPALVALVGAAIVGYAVWSIVKGVTDRWRKELEAGGQAGAAGTALTWTARIGYVGRGAAFAVVGGLLIWGALTQDPQKSGGLDGALRTVRDAPAGQLLLILIAVGLMCFGVFNFAKARHLRSR